MPTIANKRIDKLQKTLADHHIVAAFLIYHRDVYYYAGTARPASLVVTPDDAVLFVRRGLEWLGDEPRLDDVREGGLSSILDWLRAKKIRAGTAGIEMDLVPANMYVKLKMLLPGLEFVDVSSFIVKQRMVKDKDEIESIRGACRMVEESHRRLPEVLKEGITELELSAELESVARRHGHETFAILRKRLETEMGYALILSGESTRTMGGYGQVVTGKGLSPAFPYGPSQKKVKQGDVVVFDIAGLNRGYHSDLARTYCLGKASNAMLEAHAALVAIQSAMLEVAKPGVSADLMYRTAVKKAKELGWADHFQGHGRQKGTFVGHGLGLEIDEPPLLGPRDETVTEENMTFTTELFIVHPQFGEVKLEDTVLITKSGPEFLTTLERELTEV